LLTRIYFLAGYKSLRRLRNLQILNFSSNEFNNSIFPFLNAATSLTTLSLRRNNMYGPIPLKGMFLLLVHLLIADVSLVRLFDFYVVYIRYNLLSLYFLISLLFSWTPFQNLKT